MANGENVQATAGPYDPEFYGHERKADRPELTYVDETAPFTAEQCRDLASRGIVSRQPGDHVARAGELIPDDRRVLEAVTAAASTKLASLRALHLESKSAVEGDIASALARTRTFADAAVKALGEVGRSDVLAAVGAFFADEIARLQ